MHYIVHGILQSRILEWVAVPFSRDLPNPEIKPRSPTLQADSLPAEPPGRTLGISLRFALLQVTFKPPEEEQRQPLGHILAE